MLRTIKKWTKLMHSQGLVTDSFNRYTQLQRRSYDWWHNITQFTTIANIAYYACDDRSIFYTALEHCIPLNCPRTSTISKVWHIKTYTDFNDVMDILIRYNELDNKQLVGVFRTYCKHTDLTLKMRNDIHKGKVN
jgi:hypothetical protein